jgi:hypothetical protein
MGDDVDVVKAVREVDLVKAISEKEGPWITSFRQHTVEAIATMVIDPSLLHRWLKLVTQFMGASTEERYRRFLTAGSAGTLKEMCGFAIKEHFGVFTCSYG